MKSSIPTSPRMKYAVSSLPKTVTVCPPFAGFVLGRECQVWALCSLQGAKDPLEMLCLLILTDASVQAPTWKNFWPVVHKIHILSLKKVPFESASYNLGSSLGANWFQWDMPDMMTWHVPRGRGRLWNPSPGPASQVTPGYSGTLSKAKRDVKVIDKLVETELLPTLALFSWYFNHHSG